MGKYKYWYHPDDDDSDYRMGSTCSGRVAPYEKEKYPDCVDSKSVRRWK